MARVALDAMGSDHGPDVTVTGAVLAAEQGHEVILVGDEAILGAMLAERGADLPVVHASQTIEMHEDPAAAIREKSDSSVAVAARLVRTGEADAMVSAGSTGAALAAAAIIIGRLPGVHRPAIATIFPTPTSATIVLDGGANPDCRPEYLAQFGVMGSIISEAVVGIERPRVGLMNIGEEPSKGRDLEKAAFAMLSEAPINFIGNVEGGDLARGVADVFVTDGFTGNVVLKTSEGTARFAMMLAFEGVSSLPPDAQGPVLDVLAAIRDRLSPERYGGAHLVGTRGVVIIAHGSSSERAIHNAVAMAADGAKAGMVEHIQRRLAAM